MRIGHRKALTAGLLIAAPCFPGLISCRSTEWQGARARQLEQPGAGRIQEVTVSQLSAWIATRRQYTLIDVREDGEWSCGHAAGALHIPRWTLSERLPCLLPDRDATVVLYCLGGVRSAAAAATLERMGYRNVFSLAGGFKEYREAGLPVI